MDNNRFGFKNGDLEIIIKIIDSYKAVDKAVVFGSRAKGNYKQGSDVDLALFTNDKNIAPKISFKLNEESLMPYKFDVVDYNTLNHPEFIDHINRVGVVIYEKQKP